MDIFILSQQLVEIYKLPKQLTKSCTFSTYDLILCLLQFGSIRESAEFLEVSESALEHVIERNLRSYFFENKPSRLSWKVFLLSLFDLKFCSSCYTIKELEDFSIDNSKPQSLRGLCKDCDKLRSSRYRAANVDSARNTVREHYTNNKRYYLHRNALRRARQKLATPSWADLSLIKDIYLNCPTGMHVDHIYPLSSDWVCGLHVESNLQYLSVSDNLKKSNKNIGQ